MNINIADAVGWYAIFLFSVTVHEAAHAWAAKRGGDLTAYYGGQVSLNPVPHIRREPLGMVVFPVISSLLIGWPFGYASAPYDPYWAHRHPQKAAWMAAAGPAANLSLVLLSIVIIKAGIMAGVFSEPDRINFKHLVDPESDGFWAAAALFVSMLFTLNLILTVLNMIPFPPLDGSSVIMLFLSDDAARRYQEIISNPIFGFIGLLLAWKAFGPIFKVIFLSVMNIVYYGANYS
jgi:Zn-dependent protease